VAYTTTKHGIVGLSTSLREEARSYNVKVSVVCPSIVRTPIIENNSLLKIDREKIVSSPIYKRAPSAERAVRKILKGVRADKAIIPVNSDAGVIWRLYRYVPFLALLHTRLKLKLGRRLVARSQTS
jgi:short-subunit dehydrogenase